MRSGQGALGIELQLQLAGEVKLLEQLVLADVGADHLLDLAAGQEDAETEIVDPAIVGDHRQLARPGGADGGDQVLRNAAQAKAAGHDRHAVEEHALEHLGGAGADLVDHRETSVGERRDAP